MAGASKHLLVDVRDRVATLTMNRPEKLNALSDSMIDVAIATLERLGTDPDIGCIVLTGAGRGFCAGGDVSAMSDGKRSDWTLEERVFASDEFRARVHELAVRIAKGPQVAYRYMKTNVHSALDEDFRASLDREAVTQIRSGQTEDHKEGVVAFLEKREPRFGGR